MIAYRSLWEALLEILAKSSSWGPALRSWDALRWRLHRSSSGMLTGNFCMKIHLWRSFEILLGVLVWASGKRHSVASCAKTSSCCCSYDNVKPDALLFHSYCCLYLVHWLPTPHTVWGLLPMFFLNRHCIYYIYILKYYIDRSSTIFRGFSVAIFVCHWQKFSSLYLHSVELHKWCNVSLLWFVMGDGSFLEHPGFFTMQMIEIINNVDGLDPNEFAI